MFRGGLVAIGMVLPWGLLGCAVRMDEAGSGGTRTYLDVAIMMFAVLGIALLARIIQYRGRNKGDD